MAARDRAWKGRNPGIPNFHIGSPGLSCRRVILAAYAEALAIDLAVTLLELEGCHVLLASSAPEALRISRAFQGTIDLALTDVDLPGLGCTDLCSRLFEERLGIRMLVTSGTEKGTGEADGSRLPSLPGMLDGKILKAKAHAVLAAPVLSVPYVHMIFFEKQPVNGASSRTSGPSSGHTAPTSPSSALAF